MLVLAERTEFVASSIILKLKGQFQSYTVIDGAS